ncbi:PREDICTED: BMP-binding endothelial regulator protein isoform X1 [Polistes dominula]|uniref:BMP-binding endothelial regulator protein isoform X1 n=1 Tax=Polistes dominula TaxID=743375 RepID=A0ABM1IRD7_POLDO|nr:PREDICTED: BMP-binding endothelial regulator protein isoform X1 [Polistes dominula]XP_015182768.1 PREDICTED: BMP-binding endothelial regulator protein isoform X1 [Polistes dominula]XP_015182770.1 PREDICTED: BMP-binding endothelial regulator protein isoform X1 [Polistes dominula]XP_015182771.1 PREDICTED: BMP-binding endothelial regulator protein isoform X1 [Polistes dominula]XP_015182772.1 PREDICTED: BMP-binding endothelial regulator protein isoform X1 [Polistes dominula]XP_015182773.1 PREDI
MELVSVTSSTSLALALALAFLSTARRCDSASESIKGSRETCDIEGEDFTVDKIPNTRCFTCICKNGFVECQKQQCPNIDGCYTLLEVQENQCCRMCKGCLRNGVYHESGAKWNDRNDPCKIFMCRAGVITESRQRCYTPCSKPMPALPGECCPVCPGCFVNGQKVTDERSFTTIEDPCVTCQCNSSRLNCSKHACPVLHCPASRIFHEPGECCPRCKGITEFLPPPKGGCILGTTVHNSGSQFYVDECTRCICTNSVISCVRETCPVLECTSEHQTTLPGRCCPQCPLVEESRASCTYGGRTYGDGETWKLDSCKACACMQGKVRCAMPKCPPLNLPCPPNSKLEHPKDQCCPRCVEGDGVCTVFGDPHYRTFDGKFFSFKGACKYQLASDCVGHTFSIRVTNDAGLARSSAWTKTIAIKIGDLKVNLGQKMKVKVNGKRVDVPYSVENKLDVNRTADSIIVNTPIGIKVLWDGISFLEISASTSYRGRLCGLCGNFNSLPKDDFMTRRGRLLQDPQPFGQSWAVGAKKTCTPKSLINPEKERRCRGRKDHRLCNRLRSQIFDPCHKKVNPTMYYKACLQDMCECPTEHCYCESFMAYVHECTRLGIQLPHWRKSTRCRTIWDQSNNNPGPFGKRLH